MPSPARQFFATFPAGCFEIVESALRSLSGELVIIDHDDSALRLRTKIHPVRMGELRFLTAVYAELNEARLAECRSLLRGRSYRLHALFEGKPTALPEHRRKALTSAIEGTLHLRRNSRPPTNDFVVIRRRGGREMLTLKVQTARRERTARPAGALRPELVNVLLLWAGVTAGDVVLDPFAGTGAITNECLSAFDVEAAIAIDLHPKYKGVLQDDARTLASIPDSSINRVVTDPPWGIYEFAVAESLYRDSLRTIDRVLKPGGVAVILSGSSALDDAIVTSPLRVSDRVSILVSGKKARVWKAERA